MAMDEEGCGSVCISLFDMSEGKGRASKARCNPTTFGHTSMEMG